MISWCQSQLVDGECAVGPRAGDRRAAGVDDAIELDDRPAVEADVPERGDAALDVHASASQFDPLVAGRRLDRADVLEMDDRDRLAVLADEAHGIAAALLI